MGKKLNLSEFSNSQIVQAVINAALNNDFTSAKLYIVTLTDRASRPDAMDLDAVHSLMEIVVYAIKKHSDKNVIKVSKQALMCLIMLISQEGSDQIVLHLAKSEASIIRAKPSNLPINRLRLEILDDLQFAKFLFDHINLDDLKNTIRNAVDKAQAQAARIHLPSALKKHAPDLLDTDET